MQPTHIEELPHGFRVEIHHDDDPANPREDCDTFACMAGWSRDRMIGDEQPRCSRAQYLISRAMDEFGLDDFLVRALYREPDETPDDLWALQEGDIEGRVEEDPGKLLRNMAEHGLILGLDIGYHGDVSVCDAELAARNSGDYGFIWVTNAQIISEYGAVTPETIERARKLMQGEVEEYSDWATGNVYGFKILGPAALDEDGDEDDDEREELDACWGFVGDYEEYCLPEAISQARHDILRWVADKPSIPLPRERSLALPA
jgi:hypothetical protein